MNKQQGNAKDREQQIREAIAARPRAVQRRLRLAQFLFNQGRLDEALDEIAQALELRPGNSRLYQVKASVLFRMGRKRESVEAVSTAVELAPKSIKALIHAARLHLDNLQPGPAQEFLDIAMELDPGPEALKKMRNMQQRLVYQAQQSENDPVTWYSRKLKRRIRNVAAEQKDSE